MAGLGAMARGMLTAAPEGEIDDDAIMTGRVDLGRLNRACLKLNLESRGLPADGTKLDMRERLLEWVTSKFDFENKGKADQVVESSLDRAKEESGSVYACGVNHCGQLGMGDRAAREIFECVPALKGRNVDTVSAGPDFALAVTEDRYVYAWGGGGLLPLGTPEPEVALEGPAPHSASTASSAAGGGAGSAWSEDDDRPYDFSGAALARRARSRRRQESTAHLSPRVVESLRGEGIVGVAAGVTHMAAVSDGGDLFVWGSGRHGQLGSGKYSDRSTPALLEALQSEFVASAALGHSHTVGLSRDGVPFAWGRADQGCLGVGTLGREGVAGRYAALFPAPTPLPALSGRRVVRQLACGPTHTLALTDGDCQVWSWGDGAGGRLGHGDSKRRADPCRVEALAGEAVLQVACGTWHSAAVVEVPPFIDAGVVFTWGTGLAGQLGQGDRTASPVPSPVHGFQDRALAVRSVACGSHHNAALTSESQLFTWGSNKYGCLGAEVVDEFVAYPQRVWAFDVLFDGVGRGTPRSVAVGREFTIVACYPYAGPSEEEVIEAEREAAREAEAAAKLSRTESRPATRVSFALPGTAAGRSRGQSFGEGTASGRSSPVSRVDSLSQI